MRFETFYLREDFEVLEDKIIINSLEDVPKTVFSKINTYMKRKGFDWRGPDDVKAILKRQFLDRDKPIKKEALPDHYEAIKRAVEKKEVSPDEQVLKAVRRRFGLTNNLKFAGYIMRDGKLLDLSGRKFGNTYARAREMDHREIGRALENIDHPAAQGGSDGMIAFQKLGPIRIDANVGLIDMEAPPTQQQRNALRRYINSVDQVLLELNGKGERYYEEFDQPINTSNIIKKIDHYYAGQLREPSLTAKFHESNDAFMDSVLKGVEKFNIPKNYIDGELYLTLHHGTSKSSLNKILRSEKFKTNTYFAPDRETAYRYAQMTGSNPVTTIAVVKADELAFDGNYFYATRDLSFGNGVYK